MIGAWLAEHGWEIHPGTCAFCGAPAASRGRKPKIVCARDECRMSYQREHGRIRRGRAPRRRIVELHHPRAGVWCLSLECGHAGTARRSTRPPWRTFSCAACRVPQA